MVAKNHCLMRLRDKGAKSVKELTDHNMAEQETDRQDLLQNEKTYEFWKNRCRSLMKNRR